MNKTFPDFRTWLGQRYDVEGIDEVGLEYAYNRIGPIYEFQKAWHEFIYCAFVTPLTRIIEFFRRI